MQRSAPRRNHLKYLKENLTLLKLVKIMRQMIQKIFLKKQKKSKIDSKKKTTMFYPLKVVKEIIVIESDDE